MALLGVLLAPVGFSGLGGACAQDKEGTSLAVQCGLRCTLTNRTLDVYTLCEPWEIGTAFYFCIAGVATLGLALVSSHGLVGDGTDDRAAYGRSRSPSPVHGPVRVYG